MLLVDSVRQFFKGAQIETRRLKIEKTRNESASVIQVNDSEHSQMPKRPQDNSLRDSGSFAKLHTTKENYSSWQMGRYGTNTAESMMRFVASRDDIDGKTLDARATTPKARNCHQTFMYCQLNAHILEQYRVTAEQQIARREALIFDTNRKRTSSRYENAVYSFDPMNQSLTDEPAVSATDLLAITDDGKQVPAQMLESNQNDLDNETLRSLFNGLSTFPTFRQQ
jgi:hypothetical protein